MSFNINWDNLVADNAVNEAIQSFLDEQFKSVELPSYIDGLAVTKFDLGTIPPDITIRHIGDPFDEFYDEDLKDVDERLHNLSMDYMKQEYSSDEDDGSNISISGERTELPASSNTAAAADDFSGTGRPRNAADSLSIIMGNKQPGLLHNSTINYLGLGALNTPTPQSLTRSDTPANLFHLGASLNDSNFIKSKRKAAERAETDLQIIVDFQYEGNLEIEIAVNLLVNYPSPRFISLPIKLHVTGLVVHSIAVVAYLKKAVYVSFLCDISDQTSDYFTSSHHTSTETPAAFTSGGNFVEYVNGSYTQERIDIIKKIHIESDIGEAHQNVLHNVGKVEKFLVDRLRGILRDEVAWPGWICLDLSSDDSDNDNNDNGAEESTVHT